MNYLAQSQITQDHFIITRATACAATLGVPNPPQWTMSNIWELSAQPGWAAAYAEAAPVDLTEDPAAWVPSAGRDPSVITDQMIFEAIQSMVGNKPSE